MEANKIVLYFSVFVVVCVLVWLWVLAKQLDEV